VGARLRDVESPRNPDAKRGGTAEAVAFVPAWGDCMRIRGFVVSWPRSRASPPTCSAA
jgi:hypothetical protein